MKYAQQKMRTGMNEDCSMFEGAPPTGSHVTIDLDLAVVRAASFALSALLNRRRWKDVNNPAHVNGNSSGINER
jgi:hypothetical protein